MERTRVALLVAGCLGSLAAISTAEAQSRCPVAGRYAVVGRIPGATGQYTGEASITATDTGCRVRWFPPNDSTGTGIYSNGVLSVSFTFANGGGSGIVRYTRAPNGELHGVWWMNGDEGNQGTETLRPL
jgi:hypothetical protein